MSHSFTFDNVVGQEGVEEHGVIDNWRRISLILMVDSGHTLFNSSIKLPKLSCEEDLYPLIKSLVATRTTRIRTTLSHSLHDMTTASNPVNRVEFVAFPSLPSKVRRFEILTLSELWLPKPNKVFHRSYLHTCDPLDIS